LHLAGLSPVGYSGDIDPIPEILLLSNPLFKYPTNHFLYFLKKVKILTPPKQKLSYI